MTALTEDNEPTDATIAPLSATTTASIEITLAERLESVKAGLLGALTASLVFGVLLLVHGWLSLRFAPLAALSLGVNSWMVLVSVVIAAISGFLFGITYRYIIRQDPNPHLKAGAVLAFGLVRGLAQAEGKLDESIALLPLVSLGVESVLLFAGVRMVLDWTLFQGWLKPFGTLTILNRASAKHPASPTP